MSNKVIYLVFSILLVNAVGPAAADLGNDPALIIYYSYDAFDDVVPDESGKGHNGTVEGEVTFEPEGLHKGAARFATTSYLDLNGPEIPAEDIPTKGITLAAWANCEDTGGHHAIFNARAGDATWVVHPELRSEGNFRWLLRAAGGTTIFDVRAGTVTWDEWLHFAGTYDQATGKVALYINGQAVNEQTLANAQEIVGDWDNGARVGFNIDNARPFTGLMDDFCLFNRSLAREEVLSIMPGLAKRGPAFDPVPEEETLDVPRDVVLGWTAGPYAVRHDVYLGTVFDDVNNADRANPMGVLVSEDQEAATYPVGLLDYGQTYYWRVDEVNGAPDFTIFKGNVWSFTTEPFAYAIENIIATSNLTSEPGAGPEKTIDGSGLNDADEHSTAAGDMWLGVPAGEEPLWIQYEFDHISKLHEIDVWNYNAEFELILGFGLKDIAVEYSTDGTEWTLLENVTLAQASAKSTYTYNTTVDGQGVAAKYVRFAINSGYSLIGQYGLSEVRFLYIPTQARSPEPADGAIEVDVDTVLNWRAGREAAMHQVYLGSDAQAVAAGTAPVQSLPTSNYQANDLDFGTTYYWRVDEVNEVEATNSWEGALWSFTTREFGTIEDFEAYNDDDNRIYDTWLDGWVNETGSTVGYLSEPFAERKTVHGGKQSMPLGYSNAEAPFYSEASRIWSVAQDWTAGGADSLRLYFQGKAGNTPATLYVAIADSSGKSAVVVHSDPDAVLVSEWKEWVVLLGEFAGIDLARVESLSVGLGNPSNPQAGGTGLIFVDDIGIGHAHTIE